MTQLLQQLSGGNRLAVDELTPLVYQELTASRAATEE